MAAYGQEMQGLGFTEAWLMAAGKQLIWQRFLQSKIRKRAKSLPVALSNDEAGPPATSQVFTSAACIMHSELTRLYFTEPCLTLLINMYVLCFDVIKLFLVQ